MDYGKTCIWRYCMSIPLYKATSQRSFPSLDSYKVIVLKFSLILGKENFAIEVLNPYQYEHEESNKKNYWVAFVLIESFETEFKKILKNCLSGVIPKKIDERDLTAILYNKGIILKPVENLDKYSENTKFIWRDLDYFLLMNDEDRSAILKKEIEFICEFIDECDQKIKAIECEKEQFDRDNIYYLRLSKIKKNLEKKSNLDSDKINNFAKEIYIIEFEISTNYIIYISKFLKKITPKMKFSLEEKIFFEGITDLNKKVSGDVFYYQNNQKKTIERIYIKAVFDQAVKCSGIFEKLITHVDKNIYTLNNEIEKIKVLINKLAAWLKSEKIQELRVKIEDLKQNLESGYASFIKLDNKFINDSNDKFLNDCDRDFNAIKRNLNQELMALKSDLYIQYNKEFEELNKSLFGCAGKILANNLTKNIKLLIESPNICSEFDADKFSSNIINIKKDFEELRESCTENNECLKNTVNLFFIKNKFTLIELRNHADKIQGTFWNADKKVKIIKDILCQLENFNKKSQLFFQNFSDLEKIKEAQQDLIKLSDTISSNIEHLSCYRGFSMFRVVAKFWGGGKVTSQEYIAKIEEDLLNIKEKLGVVDVSESNLSLTSL